MIIYLRVMKFYFFIFFFLSGIAFAQYNDLNNRFLLAQSYEQAGELVKAKQIYEEVYRQQPQNIVYFQALNRLYIQLKEFGNSINLLNERIKQNPNDLSLYGFLGQAYYLSGNESEAYNTFNNTINIFGNKENIIKALSNFALEVRAFDLSINLLLKGKSVSSNPIFFSFDLANLYFIKMDYESFASELCEILERNPEQLDNVSSRLSMASNKPEALEILVKIFENKAPEKNLPYAVILSDLYIQQGEFRKAFELIKILEKNRNSNGAELFYFAQKTYQYELYDLTSEVYEFILQEYKNSPFIPSVKLGYSKAYEMSLEMKLKESNVFWKPIQSKIVIDKTAYLKAIDKYKEIISMFPNSEVAVESYLHLGIIYLERLNEPVFAEENFMKIITDFPLSNYFGNACFYLAQIRIAADKLDEAKIYLEKVINNQRLQVEEKNLARFNKAKLCFYKIEFDECKQLLSELISQKNDNATNDALALSLLLNTSLNDSSQLVSFAKAELLIEQDKLDESIQILKSLINSESFILKNFANLRLAEIEIAKNNFENALLLLSKESEDISRNFFADEEFYLIGNIYEFGYKDVSKAINVYNQFLIKFPNSLYLDEVREKILNLKNKQNENNL